MTSVGRPKTVGTLNRRSAIVKRPLPPPLERMTSMLAVCCVSILYGGVAISSSSHFSLLCLRLRRQPAGAKEPSQCRAGPAAMAALVNTLLPRPVRYPAQRPWPAGVSGDGGTGRCLSRWIGRRTCLFTSPPGLCFFFYGPWQPNAGGVLVPSTSPGKQKKFFCRPGCRLSSGSDGRWCSSVRFY